MPAVRTAEPAGAPISGVMPMPEGPFDDTAPALRERRAAIAQAPVAADVASGGSGGAGRIATGAPVGRVATPVA